MAVKGRIRIGSATAVSFSTPRYPPTASAESEQLLADALPPLEHAAGAEIEGRVAASPNAFDDIVAELGRRKYSEIILETLPSHVSHWLHLDLAQRIAHLGYPLTTVTPTA